MKFSTVALSLPLIAMVQAGISSPTYYKPEHNEEHGVETVEFEFALGVRENVMIASFTWFMKLMMVNWNVMIRKSIATANQKEFSCPAPSPSAIAVVGGNEECDKDCDDEHRKKGSKQYKRGEVKTM